MFSRNRIICAGNGDVVVPMLENGSPTNNPSVSGSMPSCCNAWLGRVSNETGTRSASARKSRGSERSTFLMVASASDESVDQSAGMLDASMNPLTPSLSPTGGEGGRRPGEGAYRVQGRNARSKFGEISPGRSQGWVHESNRRENHHLLCLRDLRNCFSVSGLSS